MTAALAARTSGAERTQGGSAQRWLQRKSERDIEDAIRFNRRRFGDPYAPAVIRDVIGVSRFPAVSDRDLALAVARWQGSHGVAQDGRLGAVTVTYVVEELQAEGNPGDAALLIADFPDRALLDITTAFWMLDVLSRACP